MEIMQLKNPYSELDNSSANNSDTSLDKKYEEKPQDFWVKNDFLNLQLFVRQRILKIYYFTFYATVFLFIFIMMAVLFPIDWTDNSQINVLMYKVDQWIKVQNVS